jgi:Cu-Zn family superoxide dismutase
MKALRIVGPLLLAAGITPLAAGPSSAEQAAGDDHVAAQHHAATKDHVSARAVATIASCDPANPVSGLLVLSERASSEGIKVVDVFLAVRGLAPGKHAVHVHAVGKCDATTNPTTGAPVPCGAAGSHLDLGPFGNNTPVTANHPFHSGDLVNVQVGATGVGAMSTTTSRLALSPGNLSLFDADGSAVVIHALPDTYCPDPTDPNCAGGGRAACGVIRPLD